MTAPATGAGATSMADAGGPMRVLVAFDGSAHAAAAVDFVAELAWPAGSTIRVVEAIDLGPGLFGGPWSALAASQSDDLESALELEAAAEVDQACHRLEAPGRTVTTGVERGRPATVIIDEAARIHAGVVVIGNRGHGTIASMLLGSVSAEVIDHAPAPVLVARPKGSAAAAPIRRAIVAWDGSPDAEGAVDVVRDWPILAGADIDIVTVADIGMPWWTGFAEVEAPAGAIGADVVAESVAASRQAASALAEDLARSLRDAGRTAVADVREGDAATELIAAARETDADVIVMGTHGRTGLRRLALGSVASNVTRHAPCSVLVVRAPKMVGSGIGS